MLEGEITVTDPRASGVRALLGRHLELLHAQTPPEDVHALDVAGLLDLAVTWFAVVRREICALARAGDGVWVESGD